MPICNILKYDEPLTYDRGIAIQNQLAAARYSREIPDTLLICEHTPTITLGRKAIETDLISSLADLRKRGIEVVRSDRGGEITYHAPGQVVVYPILNLEDHVKDLHFYLRELEQTVMDILSKFDICGVRVPGLTGVWINDQKIAAIGIKVSRWVTTHGFALNVSTDVAPFRQDFVPCGIRDRGVTSMQEQLGDRTPTVGDVQKVASECFCRRFSLTGSISPPLGIIPT